MIRIPCPFCGTRDHSEFSYGGDGSIVYPALEADIQAWHDAVSYERTSVEYKLKHGNTLMAVACGY